MRRHDMTKKIDKDNDKDKYNDKGKNVIYQQDLGILNPRIEDP